MPGRPVQVPRAFTLMELMVVMAIIAMVTGWGLFSFQSSVPSYQLDREADYLAQILRSARDQAVLAGRAVRVEIASVQNETAVATTGEAGEPDWEIQYFWDEPAPGQSLEEFLADEEPFQVRSWNSDVVLDRAVVGVDEVLTFNEPVVVSFAPTGVCTPIRFYLYHRRARETWRTVRLNPLTGLSTVVKGEQAPETYEARITKVPSQRR